jgi:hypothetical protein
MKKAEVASTSANLAKLLKFYINKIPENDPYCQVNLA